MFQEQEWKVLPMKFDKGNKNLEKDEGIRVNYYSGTPVVLPGCFNSCGIRHLGHLHNIMYRFHWNFYINPNIRTCVTIIWPNRSIRVKLVYSGIFTSYKWSSPSFYTDFVFRLCKVHTLVRCVTVTRPCLRRSSILTRGQLSAVL